MRHPQISEIIHHGVEPFADAKGDGLDYSLLMRTLLSIRVTRCISTVTMNECFESCTAPRKVVYFGFYPRGGG